MSQIKRATGIAAILIAVWSFLPIYWLLVLALEPGASRVDVPPNLFPTNLTLENFRFVLSLFDPKVLATAGFGSQFSSGLVHSTVVATAVMVLTLALSIPGSYAFARFSFKFRTTLFFLIFFTRVLPPISIVIPFYQFYKSVNLLGTYQGIIAAQLTLTVPLAMWVISGIFASIPQELDKQARIDGCSRYRVLRSIIIPVAAPGLIATAIVSWLTSWNELVFALFLASIGDFFMIPPVLAFASFSASAPLVIAFIPPVIAAFILQKYMTQLRLISPPVLTTGYDASSPR